MKSPDDESTSYVEVSNQRRLPDRKTAVENGGPEIYGDVGKEDAGRYQRIRMRRLVLESQRVRDDDGLNEDHYEQEETHANKKITIRIQDEPMSDCRISLQLIRLVRKSELRAKGDITELTLQLFIPLWYQ